MGQQLRWLYGVSTKHGIKVHMMDQRNSSNKRLGNSLLALLSNREKNMENIDNEEEEYAILPELPQLSEFQELRGNGEVFKIFCDRILPCVVGKNNWKQRCSIEKVSEIASPSDEAIALLLMENSWRRWRDLYKNDCRTHGVETPTLYTSEAKVRGAYAGWSDQGKRRYNGLYRKVLEDRNSQVGKMMEEQYLEYRQEMDQGRRKRKRKKDVEGEEIECEADLEYDIPMVGV